MAKMFTQAEVNKIYADHEERMKAMYMANHTVILQRDCINRSFGKIQEVLNDTCRYYADVQPTLAATQYVLETTTRRMNQLAQELQIPSVNGLGAEMILLENKTISFDNIKLKQHIDRIEKENTQMRGIIEHARKQECDLAKTIGELTFENEKLKQKIETLIAVLPPVKIDQETQTDPDDREQAVESLKADIEDKVKENDALKGKIDSYGKLIDELNRAAAAKDEMTDKCEKEAKTKIDALEKALEAKESTPESASLEEIRVANAKIKSLEYELKCNKANYELNLSGRMDEIAKLNKKIDVTTMKKDGQIALFMDENNKQAIKIHELNKYIKEIDHDRQELWESQERLEAINSSLSERNMAHLKKNHELEKEVAKHNDITAKYVFVATILHRHAVSGRNEIEVLIAAITDTKDGLPEESDHKPLVSYRDLYNKAIKENEDMKTERDKAIEQMSDAMEQCQALTRQKDEAEKRKSTATEMLRGYIKDNDLLRKELAAEKSRHAE